MLRIDSLLAGIAAVCVTVGLSGCAKTVDSSPQTAQPASHAGHDHDADQQHGENNQAAEAGEYAEVLAKLSEADRAIAVKQKVCPVSGEPLGSMGVPVKVTVKDRDVLLCCEGCKTAILDDPDTYLAKLDGK
ncbi:MAG TPA: hypothetical protein VMY37_08115 [Thermoguttaceae bacterium]|nr:hypothetical protein [Thermoguttaceae bacterium]